MAQTEQHTPGPAIKGPWSFRYFMDPVGKNDDNFHLIDGPEDDQGASILEGAFVFSGTHSEALKFARLIAAAPELLEAAGLALELIECIQDEEGHSPFTAIPAVALRTAIAKATGASS